MTGRIESDRVAVTARIAALSRKRAPGARSNEPLVLRLDVRYNRRVNQDPSPDRATGYEEFFGFYQPPFSLAPNTRFRFQSASHAAALDQVTYALQRREPVVVVTGEIGTGKTLLCRTVVERLERKTFLSTIDDPLLDRDDLLKQMLRDFGVISKDRTKLTTPTSRHDLIHALQDFLASLVPLQAHAVVIIDEAQHVQPEVLEQIRLVSNVQDDLGTMLQIILVGQMDLEPLLSRPELQQLKQRVTRRVRLDALSAAEVAQYIDHRLAIASERQTTSTIPGAQELEHELAEWDRQHSDPAFTPDAVRAVAQLSRGIPRVVNLVCDRALEAAYERQFKSVDASIINIAAHDLGLAVTPEPAAAASFVWPQLVSTAVPASAEPLPMSTAINRNLIIAAASLVLVVGGLWLIGRAINRSGHGESTAPQAVVQPAPTPPPAAPVPAPQREAASQPTPVASAPTAAPVPQTTGGAFEIVVASFRTAARANSVAADVAALGQPVRKRTVEGWQQVLAGPYASSAQAQDAKQRLERAGFTATQLVPASR
jgi:general secretion pathway protein A